MIPEALVFCGYSAYGSILCYNTTVLGQAASSYLSRMFAQSPLMRSSSVIGFRTALE